LLHLLRLALAVEVLDVLLTRLDALLMKTIKVSRARRDNGRGKSRGKA
jgi:hypothetical protein